MAFISARLGFYLHCVREHVGLDQWTRLTPPQDLGFYSFGFKGLREIYWVRNFTPEVYKEILRAEYETRYRGEDFFGKLTVNTIYITEPSWAQGVLVEVSQRRLFRIIGSRSASEAIKLQFYLSAREIHITLQRFCYDIGTYDPVYSLCQLDSGVLWDVYWAPAFDLGVHRVIEGSERTGKAPYKYQLTVVRIEAPEHMKGVLIKVKWIQRNH